MLQELGWLLGQGYLIARPLSPEELPGYLRELPPGTLLSAGPSPFEIPAPWAARNAAALG